jgi:hypothetical protein
MLRVPFLAAPRAWEALSGCPSATGGQVGWALLTVGDRCKPLLGARRGTAGEGERRVDLAAAAPPGVQGQGASSVTTCLVGKLTVGRVKWRRAQEKVTLPVGGFGGVLAGRGCAGWPGLRAQR